MILSPGAPAGRVVVAPVSLRDLPATILDQIGLADGSPFPGHTLAACWWLTPGQTPPTISPALAEQAYAAAFGPRKDDTTSVRAVQFSLVAQGRHYVRDHAGSEQLYDLNSDQYEHDNMVKSSGGRQLVGVYRRMLLDALTANPGSVEAENGYLGAYKRGLKSDVDGSSSPTVPMAALRSR